MSTFRKVPGERLEGGLFAPWLFHLDNVVNVVF